MGLGFLFMVKAAGIVAGGTQSPAYFLILTYCWQRSASCA